MSYDVKVVNAAPTPILVVRRRAQISQLSKVVPDGCGAVWNFIKANNVTPRGRNVAVYRPTGTPEFALEIGVEVGAGAAGGGEVVLSSTPGGEAVTAAHVGPYSMLKNAHDAVQAWCAAHNRQIAGPSWEVYGHWTEDQSKLRTDVFYLLKP